MKWLTPEEAILKMRGSANAAANLTATATKLEAIAKSTNGKKTAEERFQALGLLFDRERYEAGQPDFLKLLNSATDEEEQTDEEGLVEAFSDEESSNSTSPTQSESEPYIFEQCKVQVVITLLPNTGQPRGRPVLLAASSHGDFPIVAMLSQEELGSLPPAIAQLLNDLKADFPNRQIRRNIAQTQTAKTSSQRTIQPQNQTSKVSSTTPKLSSNSQTQISLF
nr:MAG: hypothetical protein EDM05_09060 [Leptolyngbya sp. IPPAS B-1204]